MKQTIRVHSTQNNGVTGPEIGITDIISLEELQHIQDLFSAATGVASLVVLPDGKPVTRPSNFCRLCSEIIRKTPLGAQNCRKSDVELGRLSLEGPVVQTCLSGGLLDASVNISAGEHHIASWLIGQVRNEDLDQDSILRYADVIGADPDDFRNALNEVPVISLEQFRKTTEMLFAFASQLSERAYTNLQLKKKGNEQEQLLLKLKESEAKFRLLNEHLLEGSALHQMIFDSRGKPVDYVFLQANAAFEKLIGIPGHAITGKTGREVFGGEIAPGLAEYAEVLETGMPKEFEYFAESVSKYFLVKAYRPFEGFFASLIEDTTEKRKAKAALAESEALYRSVMLASPDSIVITDLHGSLQLASPAALKLFGLRDEKDVAGKMLEDFLSPGDRQKAQENIALMFQGVFTGVGEYSLLRPDGSQFDAEVNAGLIPDASGLPRRMIFIIRDSSARKQVEAELRKSEEKYRRIFENVQDVFYQTDLSGNVIEVSPSIQRILGISREELLGSGVNRFYADIRDRDTLIETLKQKGEVSDFEIRQKTTKGEIRYLSVNARLIHGNKGKAERIDGSLRDITSRRLAEDAVRKIGKHYQALIEKAPDGIVLIGEQGEFKFVSPSARRIFGFEERDMSVVHPNELTHPDDLPQVLQELGKLIANPLYTPMLQYRFQDHSGKWVWVESTFTNLLKDPAVESIVVNFRDISERKKATDDLAESEERFKNMFGKHAAIMLQIDPSNGQIIDANEAAVKFYGYSKQAMVKMNISRMNMIFTADAMTQRLETLSGDNGFFISQHRLSNGDIRSVEVHSSPIQLHGSRILFVIIHDITERQKAEESLHRNELRHQSILKTALDGFWLLNRNGKIQEVNETYCRMSGYSKQELLSRSAFDLDASESYSDMMGKVALVIRDGEQRFESRHRRKNGELFDVEVSAQYLPSEDGNMVVFIHDITARKFTEKELIAARDKAEESDRLKSAFLANMSHEIRTPMNGILGFAELLKSPDLNNEQQQSYVSIIQKSGNRMLNIINDIIDFSRIESGLMKVTLAECNINDAISFIQTFFLPETRQKGLRLSSSVALSDQAAIVKTDREKLYAILTNLVKNAIKFTPKGEIRFGYKVADKCIEFFVSDTGIGIPEEQQQMIFERFRQGSEQLNRNYEGAGLGLSISRAYVQMLGGSIRVENAAGNGTVFLFTLPYEPLHPVSPDDEITFGLNDQEWKRKLKILIAEDDAPSELFLRRALKGIGRDFLHAGTGLAAVQLCSENPDIDLVLMDIKMPGIDGYEATRRIRAFNTGVVIIAQTAYGLTPDRNQALKAGCTDYISKPINISELITLIRQHLPDASSVATGS
jgi:PAS domain S-box-containing protein